MFDNYNNLVSNIYTQILPQNNNVTTFVSFGTGCIFWVYLLDDMLFLTFFNYNQRSASEAEVELSKQSSRRKFCMAR